MAVKPCVSDSMADAALIAALLWNFFDSAVKNKSFVVIVY
jgi:hypothetical protein